MKKKDLESLCFSFFFFFIERICFAYTFKKLFLKLNDHEHNTFTITREQNYDTAHETLNNTGG